MAGKVVVPFQIKRELALERIRELVRKNAFSIEPHAQAAMRDLERNIPMRLVLETLKGGAINQGPELDEYGDWRCRLKKRVAGRVVHCVVALSGHSHVYVVTVY